MGGGGRGPWRWVRKEDDECREGRVHQCVCSVGTFSVLGSSPGTGGKGFLETRKEEVKPSLL